MKTQYDAQLSPKVTQCAVSCVVCLKYWWMGIRSGLYKSSDSGPPFPGSA